MKTETIKKFMTRVQSASIGRSRDVRLSIEEASALAAEIGYLLAHQEKSDSSELIEIKVDGGSLR